MTTGQKVLVIGDDTRSFLGIVRSLGRKGIELHVAPFNFRSPALRSRYVSRICELPFYMGDGTEWLDAVRRLIDREKYQLIIPCDERALLPLDRHRGILETLCKLAIPDRASIATLFDKHNTRLLAEIARRADPQGTARPARRYRRRGQPGVRPAAGDQATAIVLGRPASRTGQRQADRRRDRSRPGPQDGRPRALPHRGFFPGTRTRRIRAGA